MSNTRNPNRLIHQSSPYLRQHAYNPVDWHPWGEEALTKARAEDKPIFLSVGYSSCHWCHVMEHESFEHADVAALLNEHYIPVKVDREEHPEIDALYMTATQLITQRGGWPNSVWLTPDGRPWYAGTYFPREDRHGRMGFVSLLKSLQTVWTERRPEVEEQANTLTAAIRDHNQMTPGNREPALRPDQWPRHVQMYYRNQFDARHGGFGQAPKFPPHSGLLLLMQTLESAPSPETEIMIERTLDAMLRGGIYDHIGGGFHRYATDEEWRLPHFEKMLYDNALLLQVYAQAAARFSKPAYRRIAEETAGWLAREMTHPDGGFYAALDADSEGEEGLYYTWTRDELSALIEPADQTAFYSCYHILPGGNYHDEATGSPSGRNIPILLASANEEMVRHHQPTRQKLLEQRRRRVPPALDNKVIAAWNGLMIGALAKASTALQRPDYLQTALRARSFVETHLITGDRMVRCWCEKPSSHPGVLDDYAAIALADLELFSATGDRRHLDAARRRMDVIWDIFYDAKSGGFTMSDHANPPPLMHLNDLYDQGAPSGVGLAVKAMNRLGPLAGEPARMDQARRIAEKHSTVMQRMPSAVASLVEGYLSGSPAAAGQDASMIRFHFTPDNDVHRQYAITGILGVDLPDGWHLNRIFHADGAPTPILVKTDAAKITWTEVVGSELAWRLHVARTDGGPIHSLMLNLTFQACTASECRPTESQKIFI